MVSSTTACLARPGESIYLLWAMERLRSLDPLQPMDVVFAEGFVDGVDVNPLRILDVTNAINPVLLNSLEVVPDPFFLVSLAVAQGTGYVADCCTERLSVIDVHNPAVPVLLGSLES